MTKGDNHAVERRNLRRKEKNALKKSDESEVKSDVMIGKVARRNWGGGQIKE